ncbi:MAG: class I SAM-dependent methyltransferase [Bacteroidota bacterium]
MDSSQLWNNRYSEETYAYGVAPNAFFAEQLENFPKGKILLPAEGQGRNAVYASKLGWEVYAFDHSEVGREKALKLAEEESVSIIYDVMAFEHLSLTPDRYDMAALIYAHPPVELRSKLHQGIVQALKPGGILLLEAFHKDQLGNTSGGPKNLPMLFSEEEMANDFEGMEIISLEKVEVELEEGPYHQGTAKVIRLIARKPEEQREDA